MTIVIDASVALKWVLDEPGSDAADALRGEELIAPVLWLVEAANALWRNARLEQLTRDEAALFLSQLTKAPILSLPMEQHIERALELATEMGHPIYDCVYLALALHYDTHVVTGDRRFAALESRPGMESRIRLLGA